MTVGELRKNLEGVPDNLPVVLSRDAEGNGFSLLEDAGTEPIGEIEGVSEAIKETKGEVVVLWPID